MCFGIQGVVDRHAALRPACLIGVHNRVAAAVGQDQVVLRYELVERIRRIRVDTIKSGGSIHIPEDRQAVCTPDRQYARFE